LIEQWVGENGRTYGDIDLGYLVEHAYGIHCLTSMKGVLAVYVCCDV